MTVFDYIVLIVIGLSVLFSLVRGMVRELLSLAGWVLAFFVAKTYTLQLAPLLPKAISSETLQYLSAFLILFLATLLITTLLSIVLSQIFKTVGLGWLDTLLGGILGMLRGVVIVCVLVFLGGLTELPKDAAWRSAMFSAPLESIVKSAFPWIPPAIVAHVKFE